MSKLSNYYENLKIKDSKCLYIFKCGAFYILLNDDARCFSNLFELKLSNLSSELIKCGFPLKRLDYYINLLNRLAMSYKVIEDISYSNNDNGNYTNIIKEISSIDMLETSPKEAYNLLLKFKNMINEHGGNNIYE